MSTLLRSKSTVFKCGKMFPIVPTLLFGYFGLIISQIDYQLLFSYLQKYHSQILNNYGVIILDSSVK